MRDGQSGFTLVELLVSMTLLALVFVILFGGLRFGMRAWERGSAETDATDTVRAAQDLLRDVVERACPRRAVGADSSAPPRLEFEGRAADLAFFAPAPMASGSSRCARTELAVWPDGNLERLVFVSNAVGGNAEDILHGAQAINFSYLAGPRQGWRDSWQDAADMPQLVRLRVTFPAGDERIWPELFVTPRISGEADCTYDPATKACGVH